MSSYTIFAQLCSKLGIPCRFWCFKEVSLHETARPLVQRAAKAKAGFWSAELRCIGKGSRPHKVFICFSENVEFMFFRKMIKSLATVKVIYPDYFGRVKGIRDKKRHKKTKQPSPSMSRASVAVAALQRTKPLQQWRHLKAESSWNPQPEMIIWHKNIRIPNDFHKYHPLLLQNVADLSWIRFIAMQSGSACPWDRRASTVHLIFFCISLLTCTPLSTLWCLLTFVYSNRPIPIFPMMLHARQHMIVFVIFFLIGSYIVYYCMVYLCLHKYIYIYVVRQGICEILLVHCTQVSIKTCRLPLSDGFR